MLPDDVFRDRLEQTLVDIENTVSKMDDCAAVDVAVSARYWRVIVVPKEILACPFELMITSDQKFSLKLADEVHEGLPVEHFELFPRLIRAIEAGRVEKITKLSADTDELLAVEMCVRLEPGPDWRRERRLIPLVAPEVWRTHRYLCYRR
ncbi:MAG: hypothetical protein QM780_18540 [Hyphomicrobium sp.]|uniref:hypothetical protein n=1 Tax=Hyphomicrobium sp. TaxID=82 RepID=UPI0039E2C9AD